MCACERCGQTGETFPWVGLRVLVKFDIFHLLLSFSDRSLTVYCVAPVANLCIILHFFTFGFAVALKMNDVGTSFEPFPANA